MRCVARLALVLLLLPALVPAQPASGTGGVNAPVQRDKPYLLLVSIDGMRWDYPDLFPTPNLQRFIADGARADRLLPAWPTLTFPNHYTLVTGLMPHRHGLVANDFFDPDSGRWYTPRDRSTVTDGRFYAGEPIWVTAERQGMVAATLFWVGSTASIGGVRPSHSRLYDKSMRGEQRVEQVLEWLALPAERRPHLLTLYFENLDDQAHWNGIGSPEFIDGFKQLDGWLGYLLAGIDALPHGGQVTIVIVSDHGQMPYNDSPPLVLEQHIALDGLQLVDGGPYVMAWQERPDAAQAAKLAAQVNAVWRHGRAWTRADAPPDWHLNDNPRSPQLLFVAEPGYAVLSRAEQSVKLIAGDHGWAPEASEMHGVFMARGPDIPPGTRVPALRAVDVHSLLLAVLGLHGPADTDSDPSIVGALLGISPQVLASELD